MPGYLTSIMILIQTDKWLGDLQTRLGGRTMCTPLEQKIFGLATQARQHLRFQYDPAAPAHKLPRPSPAQIDNQIGEGISKFAYVGAIGPIFPGAANILALNQGWVADTLHKGSVRTAFKNARSTSFVLDSMSTSAVDGLIIALNDNSRLYRIGEAGSPDRQLAAGIKQPLMACLLGHLAGVAAHVIIQPFVNTQVWAANGINRRRFEVQLDAQVARGYFKRSDMQDGQSWTDYFPDDDLAIETIAELYLQAFLRTYPDEPSEPLCAFPPVAQLRTRFPALGPLLDKNPQLAENLARYRGYDRVLDGFTQEPGRFLLQDDLDKIDGLKSLLKDYECKVLTLDRDFMIDAYKNTRNWALDAGYDHDPWPYRLLLGLVVIGTTGLMFLFIKSNFDTSEAQRIQAWRQHGFFENEWLVFDSLEQSYGFGGYVTLALNMLLTAPVIGIFRQGTTGFFDRPLRVIIFKIVKYTYKAVKFIVKLAAKDFMEMPGIRWGGLAIDVGWDISDNVFISARSAEKGIEGDLLGYELWIVQFILGGTYFVACAATFGIKSTQKDSDSNRQSGLQPADIVLGMTFVAIGFLIFGAFGFFDDRLLRRVLGLSWPDTTTTAVDAFLPLVPDGPSTMKFKDSGGTRFPVRVFQSGDMANVNGQPAYPQDDNPATAWIDRAARDEQARRTKAKESTLNNQPPNQYTLVGLFKRAAYLSGLMMMAAVNYDTAGAADKAAARQIFQDWNLDYRTVEEWNALMETVNDVPGLLEATEHWWEDISAGREVNPAMAARVGAVFGLGGATPSSAAGAISLALQYEDSAPMANAEFDAVFGDQHVRGRTDANGIASILPPPGQGDTFRLFLVSYPQALVVEGSPS